MQDLNGQQVFPCPVCTELRDVRITKKKKPYITCDACGIQLFVRGPAGISGFYRLMNRGNSQNLWATLKEMEPRYRLKCPKCGYLFANRNGRPFSVGKVTEYGLWPVQDALGIPHTGTHAFRHATASELLEEGAPLTVVQRQLGHGDAKTTLQKYGHVVGDSQRRAINTLAEKIERQAIELESGAELESSVR